MACSEAAAIREASKCPPFHCPFGMSITFYCLNLFSRLTKLFFGLFTRLTMILIDILWFIYQTHKDILWFVAVLCSDDRTLQTLTCVYDTTFPSLIPVVWTVGDGLTIANTTWNIDENTSKTVFDYSSLSPGYHNFAASYRHDAGSFLEEACTCPHCLCTYTTVLEVKGVFVEMNT